MTRRIPYESFALDRIHAKTNTTKQECFFVGFLNGILASGQIEAAELEPLLAECAAICIQVGDEDAAEIIRESTAGHANSLAELLGVLTQISEIRAVKIDPDCKRSSANRLLGFCAGVNCDGVVTLREAEMLSAELQKRHDLDGDPRIVALQHRLFDALEGNHLSHYESTDIGQLITKLVGDSFSDTGIPSSEAIPVVQDLDPVEEDSLKGANVVLTGRFSYGSRSAVSIALQNYNAIIQDSPSKSTDIVIIGNHGSSNWTHKSHGGKLSEALALRARGSMPRIYVELQLMKFMN